MKKFGVLLLSLMLAVCCSCSVVDIDVISSSDLPSKEEFSSVAQQTVTSEEAPSQNTTSHIVSSQKVSSKEEKPTTSGVGSGDKLTVSTLPKYSGKPYAIINNNIPTFSAAELTTKGYETYSSLDNYGRCKVALASCGKELMPAGDRGSISSIYPTGWKQAKYDFVSGKYLYNRCHLIGWQLSGENANKKNLITGTRYMNTEGMLPFENMVADYINETGNHVAYRITPIFEGSNLLCSGVQMEAYSVEDNGEGICFNVYCFNVQPGVKINYKTGASSSETGAVSSKPQTSSKIPSSKPQTVVSKDNTVSATYILNINPSSKKIHYPTCSSVKQMKESNKKEYSGDIDALFSQGYTTCKRCFK